MLGMAGIVPGRRMIAHASSGESDIAIAPFLLISGGIFVGGIKIGGGMDVGGIKFVINTLSSAYRQLDESVLLAIGFAMISMVVLEIIRREIRTSSKFIFIPKLDLGSTPLQRQSSTFTSDEPAVSVEKDETSPPSLEPSHSPDPVEPPLHFDFTPKDLKLLVEEFNRLATASPKDIPPALSGMVRGVYRDVFRSIFLYDRLEEDRDRLPSAGTLLAAFQHRANIQVEFEANKNATDLNPSRMLTMQSLLPGLNNEKLKAPVAGTLVIQETGTKGQWNIVLNGQSHLISFSQTNEGQIVPLAICLVLATTFYPREDPVTARAASMSLALDVAMDAAVHHISNATHAPLVEDGQPIYQAYLPRVMEGFLSKIMSSRIKTVLHLVEHGDISDLYALLHKTSSMLTQSPLTDSPRAQMLEILKVSGAQIAIDTKSEAFYQQVSGWFGWNGPESQNLIRFNPKQRYEKPLLVIRENATADRLTMIWRNGNDEEKAELRMPFEVTRVPIAAALMLATTSRVQSQMEKPLSPDFSDLRVKNQFDGVLLLMKDEVLYQRVRRVVLANTNKYHAKAEESIDWLVRALRDKPSYRDVLRSLGKDRRISAALRRGLGSEFVWRQRFHFTTQEEALHALKADVLENPYVDLCGLTATVTSKGARGSVVVTFTRSAQFDRGEELRIILSKNKPPQIWRRSTATVRSEELPEVRIELKPSEFLLQEPNGEIKADRESASDEALIDLLANVHSEDPVIRLQTVGRLAGYAQGAEILDRLGMGRFQEWFLAIPRTFAEKVKNLWDVLRIPLSPGQKPIVVMASGAQKNEVLMWLGRMGSIIEHQTPEWLVNPNQLLIRRGVYKDGRNVLPENYADVELDYKPVSNVEPNLSLERESGFLFDESLALADAQADYDSLFPAPAGPTPLCVAQNAIPLKNGENIVDIFFQGVMLRFRTTDIGDGASMQRLVIALLSVAQPALGRPYQPFPLSLPESPVSWLDNFANAIENVSTSLFLMLRRFWRAMLDVLRISWLDMFRERMVRYAPILQNRFLSIDPASYPADEKSPGVMKTKTKAVISTPRMPFFQLLGESLGRAKMAVALGLGVTALSIALAGVNAWFPNYPRLPLEMVNVHELSSIADRNHVAAALPEEAWGKTISIKVRPKNGDLRSVTVSLNSWSNSSREGTLLPFESFTLATSALSNPVDFNSRVGLRVEKIDADEYRLVLRMKDYAEKHPTRFQQDAIVVLTLDANVSEEQGSRPASMEELIAWRYTHTVSATAGYEVTMNTPPSSNDSDNAGEPVALEVLISSLLFGFHRLSERHSFRHHLAAA